MSGEETRSSGGSQRKIQELSVLYEITRHMSAPFPIEERMRKALDVLHEKMGMHRGTLTLLDADGESLTIEIAHGLDDQAKHSMAQRYFSNVCGVKTLNIFSAIPADRC